MFSRGWRGNPTDENSRQNIRGIATPSVGTTADQVLLCGFFVDRQVAVVDF